MPSIISRRQATLHEVTSLSSRCRISLVFAPAKFRVYKSTTCSNQLKRFHAIYLSAQLLLKAVEIERYQCIRELLMLSSDFALHIRMFHSSRFLHGIRSSTRAQIVSLRGSRGSTRICNLSDARATRVAAVSLLAWREVLGNLIRACWTFSGSPATPS